MESIDLNPLFITDSGLFLRTDLDNGFSTGRESMLAY